MTTLENFYYGNISPHENIVKQTGLFAKALNKLSKNEDNLTATLSDEQKSLFDKFNETNSKLCDISEKEAFIRGFKLGLRFMFEAMDDSSDEFE
ncbi:MAG: hypothetical protein MJ168_08860 [Clostridia bacterium]|nr:hypothetical protein [Clostridia bacterium]